MIYNDSNRALPGEAKKPLWRHGSVTLNYKMTSALAERQRSASAWWQARQGQEQHVFGIVIWACSLLGVSCGSTTDTTVSTIQAAYQLESQSSGSRHDSGLKVVEAKCHDKASESAESSFLCEVQFISTSDPTERLYFDIVAVTRSGDDWKLVSGLCKR